jgi:hypothetical protein
MTPTNRELLESQQALQDLAQTDLRGIHALKLKEVLEDVQGRLEHLHDLDVDSEEEWEEVLAEDLELDHDPLPKQAFEGAEVSAATLIALDWLIE